MMLRLGLVLPVLCALACGELHRRNPLPEDPDAPIGMLDGRPVHVSIIGTSIARIDATASESRGYLWPPIIDSHVHVTFWPVADKLALTGISTVVDLAAPERSLEDRSPLHVIAAGPMLTRPAGYPLESWGSDGYGIGCADEACVRTTIDRLASEGVGLIKLAHWLYRISRCCGSTSLGATSAPRSTKNALAARGRGLPDALKDHPARARGLPAVYARTGARRHYLQ